MVKSKGLDILEHLDSINLELDEPRDIKDESYYEHMNHQILNEEFDQ
mgnify:FL=1